ncbi:MAG: hypothetical protein FWE25_06820 [Lachnospiraceae bacterium]|nr:hypothetical protein [Lachnospiraceae bacterium]
MREYTATCVRLCIDCFDDENLQGKVYGIALEHALAFTCLIDFVSKLDEAYNLIGRPQPFHVIRSFQEEKKYQSYQGNPKQYYSSREIQEKKGRLLTVDLTMQTRKGAEWQGVFKSTEGKWLGTFQTTMECVKLLKKFTVPVTDL